MCTYIYEHDVPAQTSDEKAGQKTCNKITVTVVLKSVMKLQLWEQLTLCKRGGEQLKVLAAPPLPYFLQTLICSFVKDRDAWKPPKKDMRQASGFRSKILKKPVRCLSFNNTKKCLHLFPLPLIPLEILQERLLSGPTGCFLFRENRKGHSWVDSRRPCWTLFRYVAFVYVCTSVCMQVPGKCVVVTGTAAKTKLSPSKVELEHPHHLENHTGLWISSWNWLQTFRDALRYQFFLEYLTSPLGTAVRHSREHGCVPLCLFHVQVVVLLLAGIFLAALKFLFKF